MKAICICLPEAPARIEKAKSHFESHGLTDVDFFTGINAPVAGLATWHTYEIDHPGCGFRMGAKPTGCWLGHYMVWNAMTRMPDDAYLVLEDDAELHEGFAQKFEQALHDVPSDYAFLYVGHCCMQHVPMTHVKGDVYEVHTTNDAYGPIKSVMCTHAYVIRRTIVPYCLRTLRKCWAPVDIQLSREVFPNVKVYVVMPRIISQFDTVIPP